MASLRAEMAADIANAIALYEQSFEWKGQTYACVRRDTPTSQELQEGIDGGWIDKVRYFVTVAKTLFGNGAGPFPQFGDLVNGLGEQIKAVRGVDDIAAVNLTLAIGGVDEQ